MSDKTRKNFLIDSAGQREVRNLLRRADNPKQTIQDFQQTHSLHSMFAKAFQTRPKHSKEEGDKVESLDTDSVLTFLYHLGVSQHEVHKRISDALKLNLEDEIRKVEGTEPLLNLLKSCWQYATTVPELRPVLWAVLRKLGSDTPVAVLERLGERAIDKVTLKHKEVWHPLPPLLKRLVWEADWAKYLKNKDSDDPKEYLKLVQSTLFAQRLNPLIDQYVSQPVLRESANRSFVSSQMERRLTTTQRRSLTSSKASKSTFKNDAKQKVFENAMLKCSESIFEFRKLLSDGDSPAYRPKLLYATISILMGYHGNSPAFLGGDKHLYCTLVADILLSGPLPKAYLPVLSLARTLDESVKTGTITDTQISQIQSSLKKIYPSEKKVVTEAGAGSNHPSVTSTGATTVYSTEVKNLLKKTVEAGVDAMKEADPQSLFLNPVTDAIAPGYSKVIQKPMCMKQMLTTDYLTIQEWDRDVTLMFRNCIAYNTGNDGQWFRGEARRQHNVFKNDIYPQAKKIFEEESAKVLPAPEVQKKRKASGALDIEPLEGTKLKKRKKSDKDTENLPSMQALASMLLSDPFVIRILLDRLLKCLRIDTMKSNSLPVGHSVVPSLLQLLQLAQFSQQLCASRGKRYMVPAVGIDKNDEDPIGFQLLRQYTPLLIKLFLEAELDKRTSDSKDLLSAAKSLPKRTNVISSAVWQSTKYLHVLRGLVEGAMVHVCQPGNSFDKSLAQTFPKFSDALTQLASTPSLWEERTFFLSLVQAIARHKSKLRKEARDTIVSTWLGWLKDISKKDMKGSMFSSAHECFLMLINEWAALGNLVLSREALMNITQNTIEAVDASEKSDDRKFKQAWKDGKFSDIKVLYERALKTLPEAQMKEWEDQVGIQEDQENNEEGKVKIDAADNFKSPET
mmetsp:Transcript_14689/g.21672  ORF Transcript_14689/g.21672 Transcript_14689/m.21672 type:complete len:907 (+) Transcript_14689:83-2803(+)